ncbi:MAG: hypothetical protein ACXAC8_14025 [Candidatus Hodarchaeales archaeon]
MKLAEKSFDSITLLKLKSGVPIAIHLVNQEKKKKQLVIENTEKREKLILEQNDIPDFLSLFDEFLESI